MALLKCECRRSVHLRQLVHRLSHQWHAEGKLYQIMPCIFYAAMGVPWFCRWRSNRSALHRHRTQWIGPWKRKVGFLQGTQSQIPRWKNSARWFALSTKGSRRTFTHHYFAWSSAGAQIPQVLMTAGTAMWAFSVFLTWGGMSSYG